MRSPRDQAQFERYLENLRPKSAPTAAAIVEAFADTSVEQKEETVQVLTEPPKVRCTKRTVVVRPAPSPPPEEKHTVYTLELDAVTARALRTALGCVTGTGPKAQALLKLRRVLMESGLLFDYDALDPYNVIPIVG